MSAPLADRIRTALAETMPADDVASLLGEVKVAQSKAQAAAEAARKRAFDPTLSDADAAKARSETSDREFDRDRLGTAIDQLVARENELRQAEKEAAWGAENAAALKERDELVADLKERWPKLTADLVDLIRRIEASDRRLGNRHTSAEAIARNCPPNFYSGPTPVYRFTKTRLPSLDAIEPAWPAPAVRLVG